MIVLLVTSMACNLTSAPSQSDATATALAPLTLVTNTVPPTRTPIPTGAAPTGVSLPPTQVILPPTAVIFPPTSTPIPTATPLPTAIPTSTPLPSPHVDIYSPVNNNIVAGIIQVLGNATHPFFVQYQLEYSPEATELWSLIPNSISVNQIRSGILGLWDTRITPDGFYKLRLSVFASDGTVTRTVVHNLRVSNQTATPPPSDTPTYTPTATSTSTFTPPVPTTPTFTWTPTATWTGFPTVTPTTTFTTVPGVDLNAIPIIPQFSPQTVSNLRTVYTTGVSYGNRPYVFAKAGDDNTASQAFLTGFGTGSYNLDAYAGLQDVIDFFGATSIGVENGISVNSFSATSYAAAAGWSTLDVLEPSRANPSVCSSGETPLACEIRVTRPSVILIMFGTRDVPILINSPEIFRANLQTILSTSLANGVIPVLSTIPERLDGAVNSAQVLIFNTEIVQTAEASGVPLWNLWLALRDLFNRGISQDGITLSQSPDRLPTDLSMEGLGFGFNQRNLTALQMLDAVRSVVFPDATLPSTITPTVSTGVITVTPLPTMTYTEIAILPSETPIPTATFTDLPTVTPTFTLIPPTETFTPLPPTETFTPIPPTETFTPIPPTATFTEIPSETPTEPPQPTATYQPPAVRPFPDTTDGIHVFNDQLAEPLSEQQAQFAATHYAGTQKMRVSATQQLRAYNNGFIVLHYRLGLGLGYQTPDGTCNYSGNWIEIIEGDWRREWPDATVDSWFWPFSGQNVYNCDWGWFLTNLDDPAWRSYYVGEVNRQLSVNQNDGLFADSLSVPNYLGGDRYQPQLPAQDAGFEAQWSAMITNWLDFLRGNLNGAYVIPNVGEYVVTRDTTNYNRADGVMIEGFGYDVWQAYGQGDWELQLNRALGFVNRGQVLILQSYPDVNNVDARLFSLASYLLVKGNRTFINLDLGMGVEWLPEYDIAIGSPTQNAGSLADLYRADLGVYARTYSNGLVLVNPSQQPVTVLLEGRSYFLMQPVGGGFIGNDGVVPGDWTVNTVEVTEVTLNPGQAAILTNPGISITTGQ
ncbi:MAG: hypothetical protein JW910_05145 [Anaerolineae bacterium]|nr:hypothetical protein [Anaerolineae bacterium]